MRCSVIVPDAFSQDGSELDASACSETVGGNSSNSFVTLCLPSLVTTGIPQGGVIDTDSTECGQVDNIPMCALVENGVPAISFSTRARRRPARPTHRRLF
jgi:hypothetical protein